MFYWLPGGLVVFFLFFFSQPKLLCDLAAYLPPHLVNFGNLHCLTHLLVPSLSAHQDTPDVSESFVVRLFSPSFRLQPLPTPIHFSRVSTFSSN